MKELSIEENAKAYTELINRLEDVKNAIKKQNYGVAMDILCKPYPEFQITTSTELKESENKVMVKFIKNQLFNIKKTITENYELDTKLTKAIDWLEEQGNLMKALQISNAEIGELIEKNYYLKEQLEKQGKNNMGISEATKQRLEDNLNKALEKETPESWNKFLDEQGEQKYTPKHKVGDTIYYNSFGKVKIMVVSNVVTDSTDNPMYEDENGNAVFEKDLVEQKPVFKMKTPEESLGIDSDTYNKIVDECVYGEQKPIKEHNACEFCENRYGCVNPCSMKLIEEEKPTDKIESRQEELTEFEKAVKQVMEEAIECGDTNNLKADADMLLRLVQKPAWSEEDIELLDNTIKFIEDRVAATSPSLRTYSPTLTGKEIPFLKALKDRVQPKQGWSEEDEKILNLIIARLHSHPNVEVEEYGKDYHWLKSLKHQSTWKPSDEQMDALHYVTNFDYGGHKATLVSLYEQLKKLREE